MSQFSAMETAVTSMKGTGDYLTNMIESWNSDNQKLISARFLQVELLMNVKPGKKMNIQPQINNAAEYTRPSNFVEATVGLAHCYKRALEAGVRGEDAEIKQLLERA